ncbi:hypothetical protein [Brachybacterium saurashtrense]|uniref:Uncharacterized protein n=1 Tax=Brachybacterium saurashtrense TaxID=556288 RepID=A0A345YKH1_9MICO|nr:hypothetical protein [Brachybacterium saurashtrense]AXK44423.1 hypothetical protein DWV08_01490 [Brachybacterium saurashtrense]RRR23035.1 hypothetical protein DXU92_06620 [Brachybacterium saurashtrense]
MSRPWVPLLVRLALGTALALVVWAVAALVGLFLPVPVLLSLGLAGGAIAWIVDQGADRADRLHAPALDLDVDYALPHAQDGRVRRLEDLAYSAQPRRRMTARGLARVLGEIADERAHDPDAPPLSPELTALLETARQPDAEAHPVPALDRARLHRFLRELAPREERTP